MQQAFKIIFYLGLKDENFPGKEGKTDPFVESDWPFPFLPSVGDRFDSDVLSESYWEQISMENEPLCTFLYSQDWLVEAISWKRINGVVKPTIWLINE